MIIRALEPAYSINEDYYAKKHLQGLKNVLLDDSLEVDNNAAKWATASSNVYSIVETAKVNEIPENMRIKDMK